MPRRKDLPLVLTNSIFTFAEARSAYASRGSLRREADRPFHAVYTHGIDLESLAERCLALLRVTREEHWFSHATAARLWGMPLPRAAADDEALHVIAVGTHNRLRRRGVIAWETGDEELDRTVLGLIPVIAPAEVWAQLAVPGAVGCRTALSRERLVAVGDYLVTPAARSGPALCTIEELRRVVVRRRGRRGAKALAWAVERVRAGAQSPKETELRLGLVAAGLPEPDVQVPVQTAEGLRHSDLGWPERKVLLEYHGDGHRTSRKQWLEDITRRQLFEDAGYRTIEVAAGDLNPDCRALAARIRRALALGG